MLSLSLFVALVLMLARQPGSGLGALGLARAAAPATTDADHVDSVMWYFYNEVTGEVQYEDPGNTPFETETGVRYWVVNGQQVYEDPTRNKYTWIEMLSPELKKPFFFNQETKESTWERPVDLAWRRIRMHDD